MAFDPGSVFAKIEDWYDNYYIFIALGVLMLIIIIIFILILYFGVTYGITQFNE